jgi:hypothetical protein
MRVSCPYIENSREELFAEFLDRRILTSKCFSRRSIDIPLSLPKPTVVFLPNDVLGIEPYQLVEQQRRYRTEARLKLRDVNCPCGDDSDA